MQISRITAMATLVAAAGLGGWLFLGHRIATSDAAPLPPGEIPVTATTAAARDMPIFDQGLGTVQAINTVNVKSRVDGQIMQVFFTQGQEVNQGDKLFLIDPRPYQATLDQAVANRLKDAAQLQGAQRDLERYGKLVGSGFQTRQSFEDQQATVASCRPRCRPIRRRIEQARLNLEYTSIVARRSPGAPAPGWWIVGNYRASQRRHAAGLDHPDQADLCQLHAAGTRAGCDPAEPGDAPARGGRVRGRTAGSCSPRAS